MLPPSSEKEIWHGTLEQLEKWHCLTKGKHNAAFGYQMPSGALLFSESFTFIAPDMEMVRPTEATAVNRP